MSVKDPHEELPYGTKIYVNGKYRCFVHFPNHDYVERIDVEKTGGVLTKLAFTGKNNERVTLNISGNKCASIDFKKADGREFHQDIPE